MSISKEKLGLYFAILSAILYGLYPAAFKEVYAAGGNLALISITSIWLRALFLTGTCTKKGLRLFATGGNIRNSLLSGLLQALALLAQYASIKFLPPPIAIILLYTHTLMLLFFMAWKGEAKLDRLTVITTATALLGLSFVLDVYNVHDKTSLPGIALGFFGAACTVGTLYMVGKQSKTRDPLIVSAETWLVAAIFVSMICFVQLPVLPHDPSAYAWLSLGCSCLIICVFLRAYGIAFLGTFRWSLYLKLDPVFTALFSALLIGDYLKPSQYGGIALVLISLATFQIVEHRIRTKAVISNPTQ